MRRSELVEKSHKEKVTKPNQTPLVMPKQQHMYTIVATTKIAQPLTSLGPKSAMESKKLEQQLKPKLSHMNAYFNQRKEELFFGENLGRIKNQKKI